MLGAAYTAIVWEPYTICEPYIMNSAEQSAVLSDHIEASDIACALDSSSKINMRENEEKLPSQNTPRIQDGYFS